MINERPLELREQRTLFVKELCFKAPVVSLALISFYLAVRFRYEELWLQMSVSIVVMLLMVILFAKVGKDLAMIRVFTDGFQTMNMYYWNWQTDHNELMRRRYKKLVPLMLMFTGGILD